MDRLKAISERTAIMATEIQTGGATPRSAGGRWFASVSRMRRAAASAGSVLACALVTAGAMSCVPAQAHAADAREAAAVGRQTQANIAFYDGAHPPVSTLLDVVVDRLAGHGTPAHRVWLPPLTESPTLDMLTREQLGRKITVTQQDGRNVFRPV